MENLQNKFDFTIIHATVFSMYFYLYYQRAYIYLSTVSEQGPNGHPIYKVVRKASFVSKADDRWTTISVLYNFIVLGMTHFVIFLLSFSIILYNYHVRA